MCVSQRLEQEHVKVKLPSILQDARDVRIVGCLLRKATNREEKQPKRKNCVAVNNDKELEL